MAKTPSPVTPTIFLLRTVVAKLPFKVQASKQVEARSTPIFNVIGTMSARHTYITEFIDHIQQGETES